MSKKVRAEGTLGIIVGAGMMGALLLAGLLIPWFGKYEANEVSAEQLAPPSREHFFGTDMLGRDVFARVFDAVFIDIGTAFAGVLIPLAVGTIIGTLLGISRNRKVNSFIGYTLKCNASSSNVNASSLILSNR
jgi:peptide/nickel transport system permease protein